MDTQFFQCMLIHHFSHFTLISQYKLSLVCNTVTETIISNNTSVHHWFKNLSSLSLYNELVQRYILELALYYLHTEVLSLEGGQGLPLPSQQSGIPIDHAESAEHLTIPTLLKSQVTPSTCEPEKHVTQP